MKRSKGMSGAKILQTSRNRGIVLFTVLLLFVSLHMPLSAQRKSVPFEYGEKDSCEFYLNRVIPSFQRSLPISQDDPARFQFSDEDMLYYAYGTAYQNINGTFSFNWFSGAWEGTSPRTDPGVLIGGNAGSRRSDKILDTDPNDFNRILPYASIFIDPNRLTYGAEKVSYQFNSDKFALNIPGNHFRRANIQSSGGSGNCAYQLRRPGQKQVDWTGVIYTGGIPKTVMDEDGNLSEKVLSGEGGLPLFTVRYQDAVLDRNGEAYDLLLSFTKITLAAEADITGPVTLMNAEGIDLSALLVQNGRYLVSTEEDTGEGIRIGARFEFDYRVENAAGETPEGLIFYSVTDLDSASLARQLRTDAKWTADEQQFDYRWAEGFGVLRGAASFAVMPYYNHLIPYVYRTELNDPSGNTSLVRITRMEKTAADGTANGLLFTTWNSGVTGSAARNDGGTADTGVSLLLYPEGSLLLTASAGPRGELSRPFMDAGLSFRIEQSASAGGAVYSEDYSFRENCEKGIHTDRLKVVGGGSSSTHYLVPDENCQIHRIRIDGQTLPFWRLKWQPDDSGTETTVVKIQDRYGKLSETTEYRFTRDSAGRVSLTFSNIQDAHEISAVFRQNGFLGYLAVLELNTVVDAAIILTFLILCLASVISWKKKQTKFIENIQ